MFVSCLKLNYGTRAYVANANDNNVSVIDTATNTVTATVSVVGSLFDVAITPDGTKVYVTRSRIKAFLLLILQPIQPFLLLQSEVPRLELRYH